MGHTKVGILSIVSSLCVFSSLSNILTIYPSIILLFLIIFTGPALVIPPRLNGKELTQDSVNSTVVALARMFPNALILLYGNKGSAKLAPQLNGTYIASPDVAEAKAAMIAYNRKTILIDENQSHLPDSKLHQIDLSKQRAIPSGKIGYFLLSQVFPSQTESFETECKVINEIIPAAKNAVGDYSRRVIATNERKDICGETAKDDDGKPNVGSNEFIHLSLLFVLT